MDKFHGSRCPSLEPPARGVSLVSHDFANFHWTWRFVLFVCWCVVWVSFVFVCVFGLLCFSSKNSAFNSRFILSNLQLLTDNVSYSIGNAGKKIVLELTMCSKVQPTSICTSSSSDFSP